jgi:signal transduction histidine kinase
MASIESCKLFCELTQPELDALREVVDERRFAAGEEIFKEGDEGEGVYVVGDGLVEISGLVGQKLRCTFAQFGPGDFFGEMAVLDEKPRSATALAVTEVTLLFIPRDAMLELLRRSPALSLGLLREVSERLRRFDTQYTHEFLQNERLAIVGRFARSIAHDLKNPLTIIELALHAASAPDATPETWHQAAERIRKQVAQVCEMIDDIMEFTHPRGVAAEFAPTNYAAFVEQTISEIQPEAEMKSSTIELKNPPPAVTLAINAKRLRRVFFNLIHNATDAMPDGGKITVRFIRTNAEVVTEIQDAGRGIPPEMENRLFEPFASHGKAHGTGLGLSICKRIVEDHRGRIWARSEPGRGSVFSFALPLPN